MTGFHHGSQSSGSQSSGIQSAGIQQAGSQQAGAGSQHVDVGAQHVGVHATIRHYQPHFTELSASDILRRAIVGLNRPDGLQVEPEQAVCAEMPAVVKDLVQDSSLLRLHEVHQMSSRFTRDGAGLTHTRFQHSVRAMEIGLGLAIAAGLPAYEQQLVACACILHDLKHPALNHLGEVILQEYKAGHFDHDEEVVQEILDPQSGVHKILCQHGVSPGDVAAVLDDRGDRFRDLHFLTKELADRLAYLEDDLLGSTVSSAIKKLAQRASLETQESISTLNGRVCLTSTQPMVNSLTLRSMLFQSVTHSAATLVARQVISEAVHQAVAEGVLTIDEIQRGTDSDVIEKVSHILPWLGKEPLENHVTVLDEISFRFSHAQVKAEDLGDIAKLLQEELRDATGVAFYCGARPNFDKVVTVPVLRQHGSKPGVETAWVEDTAIEVCSEDRVCGIAIGAPRGISDEVLVQAEAVIKRYAGMIGTRAATQGLVHTGA